MGRVPPSQPVRTQAATCRAPAVSPGGSIPTEGCAKPLDAPVRTFGFSRAPRSPTPRWRVTQANRARSLPQAAGDHAGELCLSPGAGARDPHRAGLHGRDAHVWFRASQPICRRASWGGCWNPRNTVRCRHIARGPGSVARDRGAAVPSDARPGIARLGTISQRSCEIAPCIAAGTGRILSAPRHPDRIPDRCGDLTLLLSVPGRAMQRAVA